MTSGVQVLDYKTGDGKVRDPFLGTSAVANRATLEYTATSNLQAAV